MHSNIRDYMLIDDSIATWDYWISIKDNFGDGYVELGPYIDNREAESVAKTIESSLMPGSYDFNVVPRESKS